MTDRDIDYVLEQVLEGIEWVEKVTGRKFDDELFIEASLNEFAANSAWGQAYEQNQNIPAPIDEKSLYSYFPFNILCPQWAETSALFRELRDELKDRVDRGIAAVGNERFRLLTDGPPQWAMLQVYRYMEKVYGAVTLGSTYTAYWGTGWDVAEDGSLIAAKIPTREEFTQLNREARLRKYIAWKLSKQEAYSVTFTGCHPRKSALMLKIMELWKLDGAIIHLNRGCEGSAMGVLENRLDIIKAGYPVLTYEGNMGDVRDFDYAGTIRKIENFFENLGLEKLIKGG